eukprot:scaffold25407_cov76-Amphora_coffeaeformis.AAC.1
MLIRIVGTSSSCDHGPTNAPMYGQHSERLGGRCSTNLPPTFGWNVNMSIPLSDDDSVMEAAWMAGYGLQHGKRIFSKYGALRLKVGEMDIVGVGASFWRQKSELKRAGFRVGTMNADRYMRTNSTGT